MSRSTQSLLNNCSFARWKGHQKATLCTCKQHAFYALNTAPPPPPPPFISGAKIIQQYKIISLYNFWFIKKMHYLTIHTYMYMYIIRLYGCILYTIFIPPILKICVHFAWTKKKKKDLEKGDWYFWVSEISLYY